MGTGKEQKITITSSGGLSKEEVERLRREAEAHAAEDARRREEIETKNNADNLAYQAEKILREQKDKIPADLAKEIEEKAAAVRSAIQGSDINEVKRAMQELSATMQKVGSTVYSQQPGQGSEGSKESGKEGGEGGETIEGEFHEV